MKDLQGDGKLIFVSSNKASVAMVTEIPGDRFPDCATSKMNSHLDLFSLLQIFVNLLVVISEILLLAAALEENDCRAFIAFLHFIFDIVESIKSDRLISE